MTPTENWPAIAPDSGARIAGIRSARAPVKNLNRGLRKPRIVHSLNRPNRIRHWLAAEKPSSSGFDRLASVELTVPAKVEP